MRVNLIGSAAGSLFLTCASHGAWTTWTNGHEYQAFVVPTGITWTAASVQAAALGGHLVTITSAEENAFVFGLVNSPEYWTNFFGFRAGGPWIGLIQSTGAAEPAGGFQWVTGEAVSYTNWAPGEPNNNGSGERYGVLWSLTAGGRAGFWNDFPVNGYPPELIVSYVVERVPAPGSLAAFGLAAGGLRLRRRGRH